MESEPVRKVPLFYKKPFIFFRKNVKFPLSPIKSPKLNNSRSATVLKIKASPDKFLEKKKKFEIKEFTTPTVSKNRYWAAKDKKENRESPLIDLKDLPPYIKKLEKYWMKLGKISKSSKEMPTFEKIPRKTSNCKDDKKKYDFSGIPARYKCVPDKLIRSIKIFHRDPESIKKDIQIIHESEQMNIKERFEIAKIARKYRIFN